MIKSFVFVDTLWFENDVKFPLNFIGLYVIRKLYEQKFDYKEKLREFELSSYHSTGSHPYIIEVVKEHDRKDYNQILYQVRNFVSLIRLIKYNRAYFSKIVCFENEQQTMSGSLDNPRPSSFLGKDEEVGNKHLTILKTIYKNLKNIPIENARVMASLRFWDSSSCSGSFEMKTVELFISLESLFTTESSEVTYKLANRMAWFCEPMNSAKRIELFKKIKKAYDLRSKVVHGKKFIEYEELPSIQEAHSITRDILLDLLLNKKAFSVFSQKENELSIGFTNLVMGIKMY